MEFVRNLRRDPQVAPFYVHIPTLRVPNRVKLSDNDTFPECHIYLSFIHVDGRLFMLLVAIANHVILFVVEITLAPPSRPSTHPPS